MSWIPIQTFPIEQDLAQIHHVLQSRGLVHRVIEYNGRQVLYVSEQYQDAARQLLAMWQRGEHIDRNYASAAAVTVKPAMQLRQTPVTLALILLSALGYVLVAIPELIHWQLALMFVPMDLVQGQWLDVQSLSDTFERAQYWRLVTPAFVHFSILHLVFNSLWTWELGRRIERLNGALFAMLFFLFAAFAANISQYFWPSDAARFGGMSGVVYAYLGYIAVIHRLLPRPETSLPRGITAFMLAWLAICMTGIVDQAIEGGVANGAHLGGLIAGVAIALLQAMFKRTHSERT
ncbi:rhomboid family intramembrane serine protease [Gilvimarinus sp. SDUM040013]|uniref:Rhomboid family intramembrane serine protease n=1 Tax=Gilvimarinus gilvus TaxID=3058038 RepID=A0ABU4S208_9GAMM|nr:rhomboid family intramembrane serine protease [Gilvimarinus sp. SDUM040013]MDO3385558.1 rhomboid family intramembrane serine protease [Gilvimarinus sp. SDUM040013]MDX6851191.1 rhomboid family intramembrane serine protease [Gilvimarinus sp. SDUM040013]